MTGRIEHGFAILKPDGRLWDDYLYPTRQAADRMAMFNTSLRVFPARRVFGLVGANTMTLRGRATIIVDRGNS